MAGFCVIGVEEGGVEGDAVVAAVVVSGVEARDTGWVGEGSGG